MPQIPSEEVGTQEIVREGRYHYAALLADPETAPLGASIKQRLAALKKAAAQTDEADAGRQEKQALRDRAEYLHDDLQRTVELEVYGAVKKNRAAPGYRQVYRQGFSALIALSGAEQEREVKAMVKGLEQAFPELGKKYKKELLKLAAEATAAEAALRQAETESAQVFSEEVLARGELSRQMRRNEGALISLYPDSKARIRLYYRDHRRAPKKSDPLPDSDSPPSI